MNFSIFFSCNEIFFYCMKILIYIIIYEQNVIYLFILTPII